MAIHAHLTAEDLFLQTVEDDTEDAPWMVMADLQVRAVDLLKAILALHIKRQGIAWYLASYLAIRKRRPDGERDLIAAPDLLLAEAEDRLLTSWSVELEGKAPELVLEVSSDKSWGRDSDDKPRIYRGMGVREYAVFAPERADGPKLFGFRRDDAGEWLDWRPDQAGVLHSRALGGFGLYVEDDVWLRAVEAQGNRLPTPREWAAEQTARAEAEMQRAQAEAARAETEAARALEEAARAEAEAARAAEEAARAEAEAVRREAAEAEARAHAEEIARLREELRRLRAERGAPRGERGS